MRRIDKGPEPTCLADLRGTPGADWSSVYRTQKQEMRERAYAEQHGLCAYCMSRLPRPPSESSMKIEHFVPRAEADELQFEWENLLGVCLGDVGVKESEGEGRRARYHCDTYRGHLGKEQQRLDLHPARFPPDVGSVFSYSTQGAIRPAPDLPEPTRAQAAVTIDRLNLNIARLQRNRGHVIEELRAKLRKKKPTVAGVKALLERSSIPDRDGLLPPYCQAAIHCLTRKLRQLGS